MSTSSWSAVDDARAAWQRADDELPRLRAVHGDLSTTLDALVRNKPENAAVAEAIDSLRRLGGDSDDRRGALDFLTNPVLDGDLTVQAAFQQGRAVTTDADAVASALASYVDGGSWSAVESAVTDVLQPSGGPMAIDTTTLEQLVTLFGIAIEAAIAARETRADTLQSELASAYADIDEPLPEMDDQPIALLPVRMETRFVDDAGAKEDDLTQLLVRVYPDQIHGDSHEEELTDDEVRWGQNFWATLWYARHPDPDVVPSNPSDAYLQNRLPNQRLRELVADIDPTDFSEAYYKRYRELKERAWKQLLDRFGRERAAYVVHALEPDDEELAGDLLTRPPAPPQPPSGGSGGGPNWMYPGAFAEQLDTDAITSQISDDHLLDQIDRSATQFDESSLQLEDDSVGQIDDTTTATERSSGDEDLRGDGGQTTGDPADGGSEGGNSESESETDDSDGLPTKVPALSFPEVPRRPVSWTQQPRAALLPDRWIAIAEWETPKGKTKRAAVEGDPIREPLPVGPSPESVAAEDLASQASDSPAPDGTEWMVDFEEAESVGMGMRLRLSGLSDRKSVV